MEKNLRKLYALMAGNDVGADFWRYVLNVKSRKNCSIKTFNQARSAFRQSRDDSEKWFSHLSLAAKYAKTFNEALSVLKVAPINSAEAKKALTKVLSFATAVDVLEIKLFVDKRTLFSWGEKEKILRKWSELSLHVAKHAKNTRTSWLAYEQAPYGSPARIVALRTYARCASRSQLQATLRQLISRKDSTCIEVGVLAKALLNS